MVIPDIEGVEMFGFAASALQPYGLSHLILGARKAADSRLLSRAYRYSLTLNKERMWETRLCPVRATMYV
jgi:hypothetical protein